MSAVSIPRRLAGRPRWRGLPIPAVTFITPGGEPDFRVTDEKARLRVIAERHCQLCNEPLGRFIFFAGGTEAAKALLYFEPAAHLECLLYAMQVCPFIAGTMQHADIAEVKADNPGVQIKADATFSPIKSEWWVIIKAGGYEAALSQDATILVRPNPFLGRTPPLKAEVMSSDDWAVIGRHLMSNPVPWVP